MTKDGREGDLMMTKPNDFNSWHGPLRLIAITFVALLGIVTPAFTQEGDTKMKPFPTVVLVHGAFAESSSWNTVVQVLQRAGYPVIAAPNPLRSVSADAAYVAEILRSVEGPIVLVGHSYGGAVISNAAFGNNNVKALVFVAGFAPDAGENIGALSGQFPGSTLGDTLQPVRLADGTTDFYIQHGKFHQQFAADVSAETAALMAATQRPLNDVALNEGSGEPAWKTIRSWFIIPELDKNIPPQAQQFMAERAKAQDVLNIKGASHAVGVSHPTEVASFIMKAAKSSELASQR
jgi:pimeloyl-ACP methyl ester carboxylesterase